MIVHPIRTSISILVGLLAAASAHAQLPAIGALVRINAPTIATESIVGTVGATSHDTLVVTRPQGVTLVPVSSISTLDVREGRDHGYGARTGALWGAGIGMAVGVLGAITGEECTNYGNGVNEKCGPLGGSEKVILTAATTALGALTGSLIGAAIGRERWRRLMP